MQSLDDSALLRDYCQNQSHQAFAELVQRHINLVYSVALRHAGNPHQAEEITQAVFIILARKASSLRHDKALSSWLFQTTHLAANNFIRSEMRRHHREQEAYMQSTLNESDASLWKEIAPLLDTAVARLNEQDRRAIVLRFYEGRNMNEVGAALGANEEAAKKRISRALEKLRNAFAKRGVKSTAETIAGTISTHAIQPAPAALAKVVTAAALAKGAGASISTATLIKATLIAMNTKTIISTITATVIVAGITAWLAGLHLSHPPQPTGIPGEKIPVVFANDTFVARTNANFEIDTDPATQRTTNSAPAGHMKSLAKLDVANSSNWYLFPTGTNASLAGFSHVFYRINTNSLLLGKRVRISGWMKAKGVENFAGGQLSIWNDKHNFGFADSTSQPITGTADWQPLEFVIDVPNEPCIVGFAPELYGNGEIWYDDFRMEIVSRDTPVTSDQNHMRFFGARPDDYSVTTDFLVRHNGHPSLCIAYLPEGTPPAGARMYWGKEINYPDTEKYLGHTVRMTVWTKSENMTGSATPSFHPRDYNGKIIAREVGNKSIRGTTDWTEHTFTCRIPGETDFINNGFNLTGSGKFWIDTNSIKIEIVK